MLNIRIANSSIAGVFQRRWAVLSIFACALPHAACAQSSPARASAGDTVRLTLLEARTRALENNPELLAIRFDSAIARGELRQAGNLRFNPTADVLAGAGGNAAEFGLAQEIEVLGQRAVRQAASRAELARANAGITDAARLTLGDVDRAFNRLFAATKRVALAQDVLALNNRLASIAQRQLTAGEVSRLDYNLAVVESGRSRSRALVTQRDQAEAATLLARLIGMESGAAVVAVLDPGDKEFKPNEEEPTARRSHQHAARAERLDLDSLTALALARRPDLEERTAAAEKARAEASLARREAFPNLIVRGAVESSATGNRQVMRPGVGLSLPVFNRGQGTAQAKRAEARQAELERKALIVRLRADLANALATYRSAATEVEVLETTVLVPARQNRTLLETAYREGKVGLPVLLLIRNQVIDAELEYWSSWLAERDAIANLLEATGENLNLPTRGAE